MKRRHFIQSALVESTSLVIPISLLSFKGNHKKLKFGVCADAHKNVIHDAYQRLKTFITEA